MPLTVHVGGADNVQSVQWAVPHAVSSWQTVGQTSATGESCRPPLGLADVLQVDAVSNAVMAQLLGMMAAFQAQISDLSAKMNSGSSVLTPPASSTVTEVTVVR